MADPRTHVFGVSEDDHGAPRESSSSQGLKKGAPAGGVAGTPVAVATGRRSQDRASFRTFNLEDSERQITEAFREEAHELHVFWGRFRGKGRWVPWSTSVRNIATSSHLNLFFIFMPFAWASHFSHRWGDVTTFVLCFLSIIPLEAMFDFVGEQMSFYLGRLLGDLLIITLNNAVEATLAIVLLLHCDLKLLQSTITGVVVLHLLLIPGVAFLTGGARIWEQNLHPHPTQLNHSLLTIGVLTILLPTAFFAALDHGDVEPSASGLLSDQTRGDVLQMSRGLSIILLVMCVARFPYIASRVYLHNPPGEDGTERVAAAAPEEVKREEEYLYHETPEINVWTGVVVIAVTIALMAITGEFLVESIEYVREQGNIGESWFGLILLPIVSFSADGAVALVYFGRSLLRYFWHTPPPPAELAKARAIDLSIQFTLFWMPFLVLLGWWTGRPFHILFDYFEVALLLGACFLVNYVTADSKTNWVEGLIMASFYVMIAIVSWWYPGQESARELLSCLSVMDVAASEALGVVSR